MISALSRTPVLGLALLLCAACAANSREGASAITQADLIISGATLMDGTGSAPRTGITIAIHAGRISSVGPDGEVEVPARTEIIDAAGRYVIPGLADMHVHFGTGGLVPFGAETTDRVLRQFLFYGVTTVFNLGGTGGSLEDLLEARRAESEKGDVWPHILATGGLLTVPGSHPVSTIMTLPEGADAAAYDWSQRGVWIVRTPSDVDRVVDRLAASDVDGVKLIVESGPQVYGDHHPQMSGELVRAAVRAAGARGLSVFAHATSVDELQVAVDEGVRGVVHLVHDPSPPAEALLAAMTEQGIYYVPTLSLFLWSGTWGPPSEALTDPFLRSGVQPSVIESLLASPLAPKSPPTEEDWSWRRTVLQALAAAHEAGVPIVAGSDTGNPFVFPGYSLHQELELMVEAGLTPMEALVAATSGAAAMLGAEQVFGTVEPGKRADLLILGEDPLEDIRNTRTLEVVIRAGEIIDRSSLLPHE